MPLGTAPIASGGVVGYQMSGVTATAPTNFAVFAAGSAVLPRIVARAA